MRPAGLLQSKSLLPARLRIAAFCRPQQHPPGKVQIQYRPRHDLLTMLAMYHLATLTNFATNNQTSDTNMLIQSCCSCLRLTRRIANPCNGAALIRYMVVNLSSPPVDRERYPSISSILVRPAVPLPRNAPVLPEANPNRTTPNENPWSV